MVRFENVGMRWRRGQEVLRDVSFGLEPGSFTLPYWPVVTRAKPPCRADLALTPSPVRGLIFPVRDRTGHSPPPRPALSAPPHRVVFQDFRPAQPSFRLRQMSLCRCASGRPRRKLSEFSHDVRELTLVGRAGRPHALRAARFTGRRNAQRVAIRQEMETRPIFRLPANRPYDPEMGARLIRLIAELNRLGHHSHDRHP